MQERLESAFLGSSRLVSEGYPGGNWGFPLYKAYILPKYRLTGDRRNIGSI